MRTFVVLAAALCGGCIPQGSPEFASTDPFQAADASPADTRRLDGSDPDDSTRPADAADPPADAQPVTDLQPPPIDAAGPPPVDAAGPPVDAQAATDTSGPPVDAAGPTVDAQAAMDISPLPVDAAGPPPVDAADPLPDTLPPDALLPERPPVPPDLVALWPLDDSPLDLSGGYPLTLAEGARFEPDLVSGRPFFGPSCQDGCNGAVAPDLVGVDAAAGVTMAAWVHLPGTDPHEALFGFGDIYTFPDRFVVSYEYKDLIINVGPAGARVLMEDQACRPWNQWVHLAVVAPPGFAVGGAVRVYLDGRPVAVDDLERAGRAACELPAAPCDAAPDGCLAFELTEAPTPAMAAGDFGTPFGIGRQTSLGGGHVALADVALFARALAPEEVVQLVAARPAPPARPDPAACNGVVPLVACGCDVAGVPCDP